MSSIISKTDSKATMQVVQSHPLLPNDDDFDDNSSMLINSNRNIVQFKLTDNDADDTSAVQINTAKPQVPPRTKLKTIGRLATITTTDNNVEKKQNVGLVRKSPPPQAPSDVEQLDRLQPNSVRWFYKEEVTSPKWIAFNGYESLELEIEYQRSLQIQENIKKIQVLNGLYEVTIAERKCTPIYWDGPAYLVLRGTWFQDQSWDPLEEELSDRIELEHVNRFKDAPQSISNDTRAQSPDESARTQTPTQPVSNEEMSLLDGNNKATDEQPADGNNNQAGTTSDQTKTPTTKPVAPKATINDPIYSITIKDLTFYWYGVDDVYLSRNKTFMKSLGLSFGKQKQGTKIFRGYKTLADTEEKVDEITHLVFVVHGIAQKLYEKSVIKNCDDLRKNCEAMRAKFLPNVSKSTRYEFLPVDWRSSLTLDAGIVESVTPQTIKYIRNKLNSSALDIMYYTSPLFRHEIMSGLCTELNRLYTLFCEKNPNFKERNGKVSVVAHSLGTVIFYDILTSNNSFIQFTNAYGEDKDQVRLVHSFNQKASVGLIIIIQEIETILLKSNQKISQLEFQPENFILLGSPLAVFLALRGVRPSGNGLQDHILPKTLCKNLFNLFHPCDAVAYRLEPLILKHYSTLMPVEVHRASDSNTKHVPYKEMKPKALKADVNVELGSSFKEAATISFNFLKSKRNSESTGSLNDLANPDPLTELQNAITNIAQTQTLQPTTRAANDSFDQVDLEKRFDYQLPTTSNFEVLSALTSHTSYWMSLDVALFIMSQLNSEVNS